MKTFITFLAAALLTIAASSQTAVMSLQKQSEVFNKNLEWRLDNILPQIMQEEGIDMWIVVCFENSEDPVYRTLNTWPGDGARRLSILVFHNSPEGFRKLSATWHGSYASGYMYENIFTDHQSGAEAQFKAVADYVRKAKPAKIGIDYDPEVIDDFSHANGLSHLHYTRLYDALDASDRTKLTSAKPVILRWYETRSPLEISLLKTMARATHELIAEFFSNAVIIPDVTTATEVRWWITERIKSMGYDYWFFPSLDIIRSTSGVNEQEKDDVIRRGDVLHCDVGISYMGLTTDMQHIAYVCRTNETAPPAGIVKIYNNGLRFQQITMEEMKEGSRGNEILARTLERGAEEGLNPVMYSHPINYFGHGSGMTIGRTEQQKFLPGTGNHMLYPNTSYAMEFSVSGPVPEWNNQVVRLGFEDDILFSNGVARLVDGYPGEMYLIK